MSTNISLTYPNIHSGVARSDSPAWELTSAEIFRRTLQLVHSRTFQISAEAITVLSIFAAMTIWVFALAPGN
ncbi:MAG: hypothetical protein U0946_02200 [Patescibacteria group bacterium]|nr:hypothetical protein [Patescibacteria group bacterium]